MLLALPALNSFTFDYSHFCRDEVCISDFCAYVLVDHHVTKFDVDKVRLVIDHRPRNNRMIFPISSQIIIEDVGSCATLVTNYILRDSANVTDDEKSIFKLLYGITLLKHDIPLVIYFSR